METFLPISYLNDFIFCPYSIYLHQVFDNSNEVVYSASPQQTGKAEHKFSDGSAVNYKDSAAILKGSYVISNRLGVYGKIDTLYVKKKRLVESKYEIKTVYQGYIYQLWAQFFALTEMGFEILEISFYSIRDRKSYPIPIPGDSEFKELRNHIRRIARYDFEAEMKVNPAKCVRCIYAALCDKTDLDHVYA